MLKEVEGSVRSKGRHAGLSVMTNQTSCVCASGISLPEELSEVELLRVIQILQEQLAQFQGQLEAARLSRN